MRHRTFISLGSNVGDRAANISGALRRLEIAGDVARVSALYETSPVEVTDQPWFLNAVAELRTAFEPEALMRTLLEIEQSMGRLRTQPKGPRNIDLDILLYDSLELHSSDLDIPHPSMHLRKFVLIPLAEIAPEVVHPTLKQTPRELLEALDSSDEVHISSSKLPNP